MRNSPIQNKYSMIIYKWSILDYNKKMFSRCKCNKVFITNMENL